MMVFFEATNSRGVAPEDSVIEWGLDAIWMVI